MHVDWNTTLNVAEKVATILAPIATLAAVGAAFVVQRLQAQSDAALADRRAIRLGINGAKTTIAATAYVIDLLDRLQENPHSLVGDREAGSTTAFADVLGYWLDREIEDSELLGAMLMTREAMKSLQTMMHRAHELATGQGPGIDGPAVVLRLKAMEGAVRGAHDASLRAFKRLSSNSGASLG